MTESGQPYARNSVPIISSRLTQKWINKYDRGLVLFDILLNPRVLKSSTGSTRD